MVAVRGLLPIRQNKQVLALLVGLMGTNAYHAATVRYALYLLGTATQNRTVSISNVRASLSGANDDQGVVSNGAANVVATDSNALLFSRTTRQTLNEVYGAQNAASGLFFPTGLNGTIR